MKVRANIFFPVLTVALLLSFQARALKDAANLALDKLEKGTSEAETLLEAKAEADKKIEKIKSGDFGIDALDAFKDSMAKIDIPRKMPDLKIPDQIGKNLKNADKTGEAVNEMMVPVYGKGKDSEVAYKKNRMRTEIQQNNIATLYAHALATRTNLIKERAIPADEVSQENSRELLQAARAFDNKTAMRINDILFMEAQIAEFEGTQFLTTVSNTSSDEDDADNSEGGSK